MVATLQKQNNMKKFMLFFDKWFWLLLVAAKITAERIRYFIEHER